MMIDNSAEKHESRVPDELSEMRYDDNAMHTIDVDNEQSDFLDDDFDMDDISVDDGEFMLPDDISEIEDDVKSNTSAETMESLLSQEGLAVDDPGGGSGGRRVGKECTSWWRSRWWPDH